MFGDFLPYMSMADFTVRFVTCARFIHTSCRWTGCLANVDVKAAASDSGHIVYCLCPVHSHTAKVSKMPCFAFHHSAGAATSYNASTAVLHYIVYACAHYYHSHAATAMLVGRHRVLTAACKATSLLGKCSRYRQDR